MNNVKELERIDRIFNNLFHAINNNPQTSNYVHYSEDYEAIDEAKNKLLTLIQAENKRYAKSILPEKITDSPTDPFWQDEMSSNAKMTGWNDCIKEIEGRIK